MSVRLHHPTLRNVSFILWEEAHPDPEAQHGIAKAKGRPLELDENGDVIVTDYIWARIRVGVAAGRIADELLFVNYVADPPAQIVAMDGPTRRRFEQRVGQALREIIPTGAGATIAPSTRYRPEIRT